MKREFDIRGEKCNFKFYDPTDRCQDQGHDERKFSRPWFQSKLLLIKLKTITYGHLRGFFLWQNNNINKH